MSKIQLRTKKASEWSIGEIGISAEQLYYLLKTITEEGGGDGKRPII